MLEKLCAERENLREQVKARIIVNNVTGKEVCRSPFFHCHRFCARCLSIMLMCMRTCVRSQVLQMMQDLCQPGSPPVAQHETNVHRAQSQGCACSFELVALPPTHNSLIHRSSRVLAGSRAFSPRSGRGTAGGRGARRCRSGHLNRRCTPSSWDCSMRMRR